MHQESLDELMAQFRQLENGSFSGSKSERIDTDTMTGGTTAYHPLPASSLPVFSWKHRASWYPYLVVMGGLFIFVVVLLAVFRPSFLFSSDQTFLWKRFFLTILLTYLLLLGTLYGLYYYALRV